MLRRYVEQLLNLYDYIDGIVEYFITYRPDVNNLKEKELIGRHLLDIYPNLTGAAKKLKISKQALSYEMETYNLYR